MNIKMEDQSRKRKSDSFNDNNIIDITSDSYDSSMSDYHSISNNNNNNNSNNHHHHHHHRYNNNHNNSRNKRINSNSSNEIYFKILVPNYAAGGVIGKGGEKIAKIQKDLNIKIKMSKNNDFFPSTNERVCLMYGNIEQILKVNEFVMEKINEKPESQKFEEDRLNQIKIIVHHNMAGSLIGKGGSHIKQIKDESGAYVQITPKQSDLNERILIIEGEKDTRNKALKIILKEFTEDPHYDNAEITNLIYTNSSYNSNSNNKNDLNSSLSSSNSLLGTPNTSALLLGLTKLNEIITQNNSNNLNTLQTSGLNNLAVLIINCGGITQINSDNLTTALRNCGYGSTSIGEIVDSISVLINYGLITKPNNNNGSNGLNTTNNSQNNGILGNPPQSLMNVQTNGGLNSTSNNTNSLNNSTASNNNTNTNLLASLLGNNGNNLASLLQLQQNQNVSPLLQLLTNSLKQ